MITGDLTIARLLQAHPELLEVLAGYHPHFKQLRSRLLRTVMAPRITVSQAARIAGVPEPELIAALRGAIGEGGAPPAGSPGPATEAAAPRPAALAGLPASRRVDLDVREDIRRGQEPFARIMAAVKALAPGQALVLRAPFEPIPLYDVLGKRGFRHWTERHADADWSVWFYRDVAEAGPARPASASAAAGPDVLLIDVRGLEPPQPMVRVLEGVERLGRGQRLQVLHDRRPLFLYPQLEAQGLAHETEEIEPGLVRITIVRS